MSTFIKSDDSHFFRNVWKEIDVKSQDPHAQGFVFLDFQKTGVLIGKINEKDWKVTDWRHVYESIEEELKEINAKLEKTPQELSQLAELEDMQNAFSKIEKVATELSARSCDIFVRDPDTAVEVNTKTGEMQKNIQETIEKIRKSTFEILQKKASPDVNWHPIKAGCSPLILAIGEDQVDLALKLIEAGFDVNSKTDGSGRTPLMLACEKGDLAIVQALLAKGADIHKKDKEGMTALHFAAEHPKIVEELIKRGAKVESETVWGFTPLHAAAGRNSLESCLILLAHGADIHKQTEAGDTALARALNNGGVSATLIETLLDKGANIDQPDGDGFPPLHLACIYGRPDLVEVLLKRGAKVDAEPVEGKTPNKEDGKTALMMACEKGSLEIVQALLAKKADVNKKDKKGNTAWSLAIGFQPSHIRATDQDQVAIALKLIDAGLDVNGEDRFRRTPLMNACEKGSLEMVQALLAKDADVNKKDEMGKTALHWATAHPKIMEELIRRGAQVDSVDNFGETPLHWAVISNELESVQTLLAHGADVNKQSLHGNTALSLSTQSTSPKIFRAILQSKNLKESQFLRFKDGTTILHNLFKEPDWLEPKEYAELFAKLSKSCDLVCKDKDGLTALEYLLTSEKPKKAVEVLKALFPDFEAALDLIDTKDAETFTYSFEEHIEAFIAPSEPAKTLALALLFNENRLAYAIASNLNSDQFLNMCKEVEKAFPKTDVINFLAKTFITAPSMHAPPLPKDHIKALAEYLRTKIDVTQKNQKLETPLKQMLRVADYHRENIVKALFSDLGAIQKMSADSIPDILTYFSAHPEALISDPDNKPDANPLEVAFLSGDIALARKLASKMKKEQFQAFGAKLETAYPKSNTAEFLFNVEYDINREHLSKIMSGKIPPKPPGSKPDDFVKLFDAINFSDPKKPHYVDPGSILGKDKTAKDLRAVIEKFVGQVKAREGIQGDHAAGSDARKEFYDTLENGICGIAHFLLSQALSAKIEEQKIRVMKEFITAVAYCGPKIRTTVVRQYNNVVRNYEPTFDNLLYAKETDHRELISDALVPNGPQSVHDYLLVVKQLGKDFGLAASADLGEFDDLYSRAGGGIEPDKIRKSFFELYTPHSIFTNVMNEITADDEFREQYATWWQAHAPDGWQGDLKEVLDEMKRLRENKVTESEVIAYLASKDYDVDKPKEDMEAVRRQRFVEKEVYEDMAKNRFNPSYIVQSLQRLNVINPAVTFSE